MHLEGDGRIDFRSIDRNICDHSAVCLMVPRRCADCKSDSNILCRERASPMRRNLIALPSLVIFACASAAAASDLSVMALSGDPASSTDPLAVFTAFSGHALNDRGEVAFGGVIEGSAITAWQNNVGLWVAGESGVTRRIMQSGDPAPDMPAGVRFTGKPPALHGFSDTGEVMFVGALMGPGIVQNDDGTCGIGPPDASRGVWSGNENGTNLIVRQGDPAPGTPPGTVFHCCVIENRLNSRGDVAFGAAVYNGELTTPRGVWRQSSASGALEPVMLSGEVAAEVPADDGAPYVVGTAQLVGFNSHGTVAVRAWPNPYGGGTPSFVSLASVNVPRALLAIEGQPLPAAGDGVTMHSFGLSSFNNLNQVALHAELSGPGIVEPLPFTTPLPPAQSPAANNRAIVIAEPGRQPDIAVRSGEHVAGIADSNLVYYGFGTVVPILFGAGVFPQSNYFTDAPSATNGRGEVLFRATLNSLAPDAGLTTSNNEGLWVWSPQQGDRLILREGDLAPGTTDPFTFDDSAQLDYMLNDRGQVAVATWVGEKRGLWGTDVDGRLHLVVREGQMLEVSEGDVRTVARLILDVSSFRDGGSTNASLPTSFNDLGQLAFQATFTDGTQGLFISNLLTANLSGDYNGDGVVDAADYVVWRKGAATQSGYEAWRTNFGTAAGSRSLAAVPEPTAIVPSAIAACACLFRRRARATRRSGC
jgi:hypothetical protein